MEIIRGKYGNEVNVYANTIDDISILQSILIDILERIWDDYVAGEQCDECGDVIETYKLEV